MEPWLARLGESYFKSLTLANSVADIWQING